MTTATKLQTIATQIIKALELATKAHLDAGRLLCEARGQFKDQKSFLAWAEEAVSLKKSQTYKLMNVWKAFGDVKWTHELSINVLQELMKSGEAVVDAVKDAVEAGEEVTAKDVQEANEAEKEEQGGEQKSPEVDNRKVLKDAIKQAGKEGAVITKHIQETEKELGKQTKLAERIQAKFEKQAEAKDKLATETKELKAKNKELEAANKQLSKDLEAKDKTIESLLAQIAELTTVEAEAPVTTQECPVAQAEAEVQAEDDKDLPWAEDDAEQEHEYDLQALTDSQKEELSAVYEDYRDEHGKMKVAAATKHVVEMFKLDSQVEGMTPAQIRATWK